MSAPTVNIREHLIRAGVKNLREFGYECVTVQNILTDEVYSAFFLSMLKDNKGQGIDGEIDSLIEEINKETN